MLHFLHLCMLLLLLRHLHQIHYHPYHQNDCYLTNLIPQSRVDKVSYWRLRFHQLHLHFHQIKSPLTHLLQ